MPDLFRSFNSFLKEKFNLKKIRKIPLNAGFSCPNKNGKFSTTGCIFCDAYGSGPVRTFNWSISEQIEYFITKNPNIKYLAYFQAHTNTYGSEKDFQNKVSNIFNYQEIIGLFVGTRPDSISSQMYGVFEGLKNKTYLSVELGLQSSHEKSLKYLNRNHTYKQFLNTFNKLKKMNIDVVVHLIIGIPGENRHDMLETIKAMNKLKPTGIKFHLLHILKNTRLHEEYKRDKIKLLSQPEYVELIVYLLENLHPDIVIHRLTGEREKDLFVAPAWALNKTAVINSIKTKMNQLNTFQGKQYSIDNYQ